MTNSRREFLKLFGRDLARGVHEVAAATNPLVPKPAAKPEAQPEPDPFAEQALAAPRDPVFPAVPSRRMASVEELLALPAAVELGPRRAEAIGALALPSVRLTLAPPEDVSPLGGGRFGGFPDLPYEASWPHWREEPLEFRAQLDLAQIAELLGDACPLPRSGTLYGFSALIAPSGFALEHDGAGALLLDEPPDDEEPGYGRALVASGELVLPRAWAAIVAPLALDPHEQDRWQQLREQLAAAQGVETADGGQPLIGIHRLLGYPDERAGEMPLACELLEKGFELGDEPPALHPFASAYEPLATRWRLLLQLSRDDDLGWDWGEGRTRLYLWIDEADLAAGDLSRVRAFVR